MSDATSPPAVGAQLAQRREDLDMTQDDLAALINVRTRTISAIERGENTIQRGRRSAWESALRLKSGTIRRAYEEGSPIEAGFLDEPPSYGTPQRVLSSEEMTQRIERLEEAVFGQQAPPLPVGRSVASKGLVAMYEELDQQVNAPPEPKPPESDRDERAAG